MRLPLWYYSQIRFPGPPGHAESVWKLEYVAKDIVTPAAATYMLRPVRAEGGPHDPGARGCGTPGNAPLAGTIEGSAVAVLSRIVLPDAGGDIRFATNGSGEIERYTTLLGAEVEYRMGPYLAFTRIEPMMDFNRNPTVQFPFVVSRQVTGKTVRPNGAGTLPAHVWSYERRGFDAREEMDFQTGPPEVRVTEPGGATRQHFFYNSSADDLRNDECARMEDGSGRTPEERSAGLLCRSHTYRGEVAPGNLLRREDTEWRMPEGNYRTGWMPAPYAVRKRTTHVELEPRVSRSPFPPGAGGESWPARCGRARGMIGIRVGA